MFKKIKAIFSNVENKLDSTKKNVNSVVKKDVDLLAKIKTNNPEYAEELEVHEKNCKNINIDKLKKIENNKNINLGAKEILFLSYVDKRQSDDYDYPRYWTSKYNLDIQKTLVEFFQGNYIKFADSSYKLNSLKVTELKSLLKKYNLKVNGRKDELIEILLENLDESELDKINNEDFFQTTEKGKEFLDNNEHIMYFHKKSNLDISINEGDRTKKKNPNMNTYSIALNILRERINSYSEIKDNGQFRSVLYNISTIYKDMTEFNEELVYIIYVLVMDLFEGIYQYESFGKLGFPQSEEMKQNYFIHDGIINRLIELQKKLNLTDEQLKIDIWERTQNLSVDISERLFLKRFNLLLEKIKEIK